MKSTIIQNIFLAAVLTSRAWGGKCSTWTVPIRATGSFREEPGAGKPLAGIYALAQEKASVPPKTKLEAFEAKTGVVIVRGFATLGRLYGDGAVEVECKESTDASSGKKEYGITITVFGTSDRKNEAYIDYDEIDSLMKGIDYIVKIDKTVTKLDDFQVDYRTKGGLTVSTPFSALNRPLNR